MKTHRITQQQQTATRRNEAMKYNKWIGIVLDPGDTQIYATRRCLTASGAFRAADKWARKRGGTTAVGVRDVGLSPK